MVLGARRFSVTGIGIAAFKRLAFAIHKYFSVIRARAHAVHGDERRIATKLRFLTAFLRDKKTEKPVGVHEAREPSVEPCEETRLVLRFESHRFGATARTGTFIPLAAGLDTVAGRAGRGRLAKSARLLAAVIAGGRTVIRFALLDARFRIPVRTRTAQRIALQGAADGCELVIDLFADRVTTVLALLLRIAGQIALIILATDIVA